MRVTNQGLLNSILLGLQRNITQLEDHQSRIASGKRVLQPADDPAATVKILDLRSAMVEANQYRTNCEDGADWLEQTDNTISLMENAVQRVREIAVSAATDTNSVGTYQALASELKQIVDGMADLGNTKVGDLYIFAGQAVNTKPVVQQADPVTGKMHYVYIGATGSQAPLVRQIAPGVDLPINVTAEDLLFGAGQLLPNLERLADALAVLGSPGSTDAERQAAMAVVKGDPAAIPPVPAALDSISLAENDVLRLHTDVGARVKRLEAAIARNDAMIDGLTKLVSKQEDLDVPKAILELATIDSSYKLSMQMGARIVQPTLLDFLR